MTGIRAILAGGILSVFLVGGQGCSPKAKLEKKDVVRPAKLMVLSEATSASVRTYTGRVKANEKTELAFQVGGPLVEMAVDEGAKVTKGQLLARLNPRDFQTRVNTAKSRLETAQAQEKSMRKGARPEDLRILESNIKVAQAQFDKDKLLFEKRKGIVKTGAISKEEFERYKAQYEVSTAKLDAAKKELEKGKAGARSEDIEAVEAQIRGLIQLLKNAEFALADTQLKAPFAGVIVKKYVKNFEEVRAKQSIFNLQDIERIEIQFDLPERVVARLKKGNTGSFSAVFDGHPEKSFDVKIKTYRIEADPNTKTFPVTVAMAKPEGFNALPGMSVNITHKEPQTAQGPSGTFLVPAGSVFADETGQYYAWTVDEAMTTHKRAVEIGELTGESVRILKGLKAGETILTAGTNYMTEGDKVRPLVTDAKESGK